MDERRLELKVGVLFLSAVAGALLLLWLMGELSFSSEEGVQVEFGHAGTLVKGAPVKLGGVPVGRVERITLRPAHRDRTGESLPVLMRLSVGKEVLAALREDAQVTVATQGPLGEPYLELYPGSKAGPFPKDKPIRGLDPPRLDMVAFRLSSFLESAGNVLKEDPRALSTLFNGLTGLASTMDGVLSENRTEIQRIASELSAAARDLRILSEVARRNLEPGGKGAQLMDDAAESATLLRRDLPGLSREAQVALHGLAALSGGLTPEDGKKLKLAIDRYASAGERLEGLAARGDRLLARLEAGEGTAGASLKDKQLYDDLRSLVSDLRKHPWKMLWKD